MNEIVSCIVGIFGVQPSKAMQQPTSIESHSTPSVRYIVRRRLIHAFHSKLAHREELTVSYSIGELDSLLPGIATKLRSFGIRTTDKLLEAAKDPKGRQTLAERTGLSPQCLLRLANYADKMRIKGIGEDYAELLEAAGVDTVRELKYRNPANLAKRMAEVNTRLKLVRALPSEKVVLRWIETAKRLPIKISY